MRLSSNSTNSVHVRVGERFFFHRGEGELNWEAGRPFHIAHGWSVPIPGSTITIAKGGLRLLLDGNVIKEDFVEHERSTVDIPTGEEVTFLTKLFVFNFPSGMHGSHKFVFYYSNVCRTMKELDLVESCESPNQVVESAKPFKNWMVHFIDT